MGILNNSNAISTISGDYNLENSLRFRASADAYLSRANGSTATLATSGTISMWVKKPRNGSREYLMQTGSGTGNSNYFSLFFTNSTADSLKVGQYSVDAYVNSTTLYRDPSAWYHIVMAFDSTESTGTDRCKIYVNGELTTNTSSAGASSNFAMTNNGQTIYIGRESGYPSDTYMSEVQLIDGQTLAATDFGETDNNGTWIPKKYTGSYGNNGFYLKFDDTSSVAALGTDSSGNGNNFTPTNISLTAGTTYDSMPDVPTLTDEDTANFATRNPLAYSPSMTFSNGNLTTNGTLASWYGSASTIFVNSGKWYWETTITVKGTYIQIGAAEEDWLPNSGAALQSNAYGYYSYNGNAVRDGASTSYGTTYTTGDVIGVALDYDSGAIWFSKNGTWQNSATISEVQAGTTTNAAFTGVTARLSPASSQYGTATQNHNYGQRAFAYTQPTGFLKLNTFNLPDSTIEDGSTNFNTVLYTGDGAVDNAITGVGFQPDWTWIKERNAVANHGLYDAVRGVQKDFVSNTTAAETTQSTGLTSFDSDGFTTGVLAKLNTNNDTYVAWNWKAASTEAATYVVKVVSDSGNKYRFNDFGTSAVTLNLHETGTYTFDQSDSSNSGHPLRFSSTSDGTHGGGSEYTTGITVTGTPGSAGAKTVIVIAASAPTLYYYCSVHSGMGGQANTNVTKGSSNFDGTIVSTVSANPTAGFSIINWSSPVSNGSTIGHGLSSTPELLILKSRTSTSAWGVFAPSILDNKYLYLDNTGTATSASYKPTLSSTVMTVPAYTYYFGGPSNSGTNNCYAFHSVEGYSKIGSYTGNGNANGTFVYTGFKPVYVIIRRYNTSGSWLIYDDARAPTNSVGNILYADTTAAENSATNRMDFVSNGIKLRTTDASHNANNSTYIYMAFAENPFKNSTAR